MNDQTLAVVNEPVDTEAPRLKKLADAAVSALADLVVEVVKGSSPAKFAEASRYCTIGQQLIRAGASRVEDFAVLEAQDNQQAAPRIYGQGNVVQYGNNGGLNMRGPVDEREVERNRMLTFGPVAQVTAEAQRATVAAQEAAELQNLTNLRATLPEAQHGPIEARIAVLLTHMETRNNANNPEAEPEPDLADPVVPRGHPAGEGVGEADAAPRLPAHGPGGDGDGGAAEAGGVPEAAG